MIMKGIVINILKKLKILHEDDPIETVNKLKKGGGKGWGGCAHIR